MTLLNTQKSCEQKLQEVNHMADKWEKSVTVQNFELTHSACPMEEVSEHSITLAEPQTYLDQRMTHSWIRINYSLCEILLREACSPTIKNSVKSCVSLIYESMKGQ